MKKSIVAVLSLLILSLCSCVSAAPEEAGPVTGTHEARIAVVPYLNMAEEKKDYVPSTVNEEYTDYFSKLGMNTLPAADVQAALDQAGYDISNQMLPDKDIMADVAKQLDADYVVAMEIVSINATRHMSLFSTKVRTSTKLQYHFYKAETNRMTAFQISAENNNQAVLVGDVGSKTGIVTTLKECMGKANAKIQSFIKAGHDGQASAVSK